jgi:hypothetical protein
MRAIASLPVFLLAGACATQPPAPVETTRTVPGAPAEVRGRVEAAAAGLGLVARPGPELRLTRTNAPAEWADCPTRVVRSMGETVNRVDFAAPQARAADVLVSLTASGEGTAVAISPAFTATYHDIYRNLPLEGQCPSTGRLERALLDAAG